MHLPKPVQKLIDAFSRLPGIGPKTASRLTFFLLKSEDDLPEELAAAVSQLKSGTTYCTICHNITASENQICRICSDQDRDSSLICVVEEPLDVTAIEKTRGFNGKYHVLGGALSPIDGIGPSDLRINELMNRVKNGEVTEIILATNPSMEGDYTSAYLSQQLHPFGLKVTRLARGLPVGGDLEYADQSTLLRALTGRQEMD